MQQQLETLEARRLLSGRTLTITGGNTPADTLVVDVMPDGIHERVNSGKMHIISFGRRLRQINFQAGSYYDGKHDTFGEHTVEVNVYYNSGARINVKGTKRSVNHLKVNVFARGVPITAEGADKSINDIDVFNHAKRGTATVIGGDDSTNNLKFGGGTNTVVGGNRARNAYFQMVVRSAGSVTAGSDASNIFYTPNGTWTKHYTLFGNVEIKEA